MAKSPEAYKTISEVGELLDVQPHVLRFWESKFPQIKPMKRRGGRRYYSPKDVDLLGRVHKLLYSQGYTIKGVQRLMKQKLVDEAINGNEPPAIVTAAPALSLVPAAPRTPVMFEELLRHEVKMAVQELEKIREELLKIA